MAKQNKKPRESQYTEILADQIRAIAEQAGGNEYKPNLKV